VGGGGLGAGRAGLKHPTKSELGSALLCAASICCLWYVVTGWFSNTRTPQTSRNPCQTFAPDECSSLWPGAPAEFTWRSLLLAAKGFSACRSPHSGCEPQTHPHTGWSAVQSCRLQQHCCSRSCSRSGDAADARTMVSRAQLLKGEKLSGRCVVFLFGVAMLAPSPPRATNSGIAYRHNSVITSTYAPRLLVPGGKGVVWSGQPCCLLELLALLAALLIGLLHAATKAPQHFNSPTLQTTAVHALGCSWLDASLSDTLPDHPFLNISSGLFMTARPSVLRSPLPGALARAPLSGMLARAPWAQLQQQVLQGPERHTTWSTSQC
jgi:hypothetical protein